MTRTEDMSVELSPTGLYLLQARSLEQPEGSFFTITPDTPSMSFNRATWQVNDRNIRMVNSYDHRFIPIEDVTPKP